MKVKGQLIQSIGFKSGLSIANQIFQSKSINYWSKKDNRFGFFAMAMIDLKVNRFFNITSEIGYCPKGYTSKILITTVQFPDGNGTYKVFDRKFNFLVFSPMLKIHYPHNRWLPYAFLGPRLDYLVSIQYDLVKSNNLDQFNRVIFGLSSAVGIEYKMKKIGISAEGQFQNDFTSLANIQPAGRIPDLTIHNQAFTLGVELKYYLK